MKVSANAGQSMQTVKLSVIVPVYNVAGYLAKCLESLLDQDLEPSEYEIIIVNDGSSDESLAVASSFAGKHSNIVVISQPNIGPGGARNTGIKASRGRYIQFVDSDDYIERQSLACLIKKMERESLDVLRFNYRHVNEHYEPFEPNRTVKSFVDFRDEICDGLTFLNERLGNACYPCQFMIKAELFRNGGLFFEESLYFEDVEWTPRLLASAHRVTSADVTVYNYLSRMGSITKSLSIEKRLKAVEDRIAVVACLQRQMDGMSDRRWYRGMISGMVLSILSSVCESFPSRRRQYVGRLKKMGVFPLSFYHQTRYGRRKILLADISPSLLCALISLKSKGLNLSDRA